MSLGFIESKVDSNLYLKVESGRPMMFLLYVDALKVARRRLASKLEMKDLDTMQ